MKGLIVFYDASCPLCSRVVQFILKHEKNNDFYFSSLQGEYAKFFLSKKGIHEIDLSTFYLFKDERLFHKSSAALRILPNLRWYLFLLNIFWRLPRIIRDFLYDLIAKNRYKIFKEKCDFGNLSKERNLDLNPYDLS